MKKTEEIFGRKTAWQGREAYLLGNDLVRMVNLTGGGHVAEFRFAESTGHPTVNPLWIPPWKTIDPYRFRSKVHSSRYGTITEGKLLSGLVGHNICLDYFGSPSEEEAAQGLSIHGEAGVAKWQKTQLRVASRSVALAMAVRLPVAGLNLSREIQLRRGESVVYFKETVFNEKKADHFFHWTQHVTLGSPFLSPPDSRVAIPATQGKTFPHEYGEGIDLLAPSREFWWPAAPTHSGGKVDLTHVFLWPGKGLIAAALLDPKKDVGYFAALNSKTRLLFGYAFSRRDFPWITVWEENLALVGPPWNGQGRARGLEFGTTPFPVLRREAFALGPLFNTPTLAHIPARSRMTVQYVAFLTRLPPGFGNLHEIQLSKEEILIQGTDRKEVLRVPASGISETGLV